MNLIHLYAAFLKRFIRTERPMCVVFDSSDGATGPALRALRPFFAKKGITPFFLHATPNGEFPAHGPNPLAHGAMRALRAEVLRRRADCGVMFDADGDRAFFLDNEGRMVDPDVSFALLVWSLRPQKVVVSPATGWLIRKFKNQSAWQTKIKIIESPVGHYFMKKIMRAHNADCGGERAGHYYFKDFFYADSGILTALHVINALSRLPYRFSDFADFLPVYYRSGDINLPRTRSASLLPSLFYILERTYRTGTLHHSTLDGLRMEFADWWFNVRASNTEPLIRLNVEAVSSKLLKEKTTELTTFLRAN